AAKNAILIVEFAKEREDSGLSRSEAAVQASKMRLRPILMTSFAFILGVVPLVLAKGAGAEMRYALGIAVFSGMLGVRRFGISFPRVSCAVVGWTTSPRGSAPPPHAKPEVLPEVAPLPGPHGDGVIAGTPPPKVEKT